jgi:ferredoxin-type protein NapH
MSKAKGKFKILYLRRTMQLLVLFTVFAFPLAARYGHYLSARQLDKSLKGWNGKLPGVLLASTDAVMRVGIPDGEGGVPERRPRKKILQRIQNFNGSPWSATVFGISLTDLLAVVESAASSKNLQWALIVGGAIPLLATLVLGRVYCGWICPMGLLSALARKTRDLVRYLEIQPRSIELDRRDKYWILGAGLVAATLFSMPVLHHIYPPAIVGREGHGLVFAYFDGAESGRLGFSLHGLTIGTLFLMFLFFLEVLLLPNFWCKSLCPGGAVYSLLSRFRLLHVKRKVSACTDCTLCDVECPMGLQPMTDQTGAECDSCGICIDTCPTDALGFSIAKTPARGKKKAGALIMMVAAVMATPVLAHHIMGIPHYSYDKNYPQAPVIKLVEHVGRWEVQATGYPGNPQPGSRTEVHAYAADPRTREVYDGEMSLEVFRLSPFGGKESIYGPTVGRPDENLVKFYPTYPEEAGYELVLHLKRQGEHDTLRFTLVVGDPGQPWVPLAVFCAGVILLLIVVRAIRIKRRRRLAAVVS